MNRFGLAALALCFVPILSLQAQDRSSLDLRATFGMRNAIIEGTCASGEGQAIGGASVRYHVTSRMSFGPEVLFVTHCVNQTFSYYDPQMSVMLHVALDLSENRRIRPYLIGGAGFLRQHPYFVRPILYRSEFSAGGGAKIFLSDRVFVAPDVQAGGGVAFWRFTGSLGIVLR